MGPLAMYRDEAADDDWRAEHERSRTAERLMLQLLAPPPAPMPQPQGMPPGMQGPAQPPGMPPGMPLGAAPRPNFNMFAQQGMPTLSDNPMDRAQQLRGPGPMLPQDPSGFMSAPPGGVMPTIAGANMSLPVGRGRLEGGLTGVRLQGPGMPTMNRIGSVNIGASGPVAGGTLAGRVMIDPRTLQPRYMLNYERPFARGGLATMMRMR